MKVSGTINPDLSRDAGVLISRGEGKYSCVLDHFLLELIFERFEQKYMNIPPLPIYQLSAIPGSH